MINLYVWSVRQGYANNKSDLSRKDGATAEYRIFDKVLIDVKHFYYLDGQVAFLSHVRNVNKDMKVAGDVI